MHWLEVAGIICGTFLCGDALKYKDLLDTSQPETFINLSTEDFVDVDQFEDVDVKQIVRKEMQKNGRQMSPKTEIFLNDPIQGSGKFEGDIELPPNTAAFSADSDYSNVAYNAIRNARELWPNGVIPYVVSSQIGPYGRKLIASSIADYQTYTCMKVVPRTNEPDYVVIRADGGCYSMIGRTGGAQTISLAPACLYKHTIIHEFMHAAGFYHEQARYDRDNYVNINWKNILPGMQSQFSKRTDAVITHLGTRYDQTSVMHYSAWAFSRQAGLKTITAKNGAPVGNRRGFSENDIAKINKLYGCGDTTIDEATETGSCLDGAAYCGSCGYWSKVGYCTSHSHALFMKKNCRKSCGFCGTDACTNDAAHVHHCGYWAKNGYCSSDQEFMHAKCKKSCGVCKKKTATKKSTATTTKLDNTLKSAITAEQNSIVDPDIAADTITPATDGDASDKNCTYRPGTRGTYSGLENKPCDSKEECCEMCRDRSECEAVTFNVGHCWMHTSDYKNNIKEDCQTCYFAEMCGGFGNEKTTKNSSITSEELDITANPIATTATGDGNVNGSCIYRSGARGTYSGLENKPCDSKEECCEMCRNRSECEAMTFNVGHCWMHTSEYKNNIKKDCQTCYFAEMCGTSEKKKTTENSTATTDGGDFNGSCNYRSGARGTYSGLENKPSVSKEECCEMCRDRSGCRALTFESGHCWMHTIEYKDNIQEDCSACFFAEI